MPNKNLLKDLEILGLEKDPTVNFQKWLKSARQHSEITDPNKMILATVGPDSADHSTGEQNRQPSMRWVQMNDFGDEGLVFSTNINSRKGFEVAQNDRVAIQFSWFPISKLIYIEGTVSKLSTECTKKYFESLPRDAQIGCVAVNTLQSQPLDSTNKINEEAEHLKQSDKKHFAMPETFSAYKVDIHRFEFIQLHKEQLDDRIAFVKKGFSNTWLNEKARREDDCLRVPVDLGKRGEWFIERFGL